MEGPALPWQPLPLWGWGKGNSRGFLGSASPLGRGGSPQGCPWSPAGCTRSPSLPPGPSLSLAVVTNSPGQYGHPGGTRGSPVRKEESWDRQDEGPEGPPSPHSGLTGCPHQHIVSVKDAPKPIVCQSHPHHPRLDKGSSPPYPLYISYQNARLEKGSLVHRVPPESGPSQDESPPIPSSHQIHSMAPITTPDLTRDPFPHQVLPISILDKARNLP